MKKYGVHVDNGSECLVANPAECDESINVPKIPRGSLSDRKLCYTCNSIREIDSNVYNEGGLGRCCSTNNARGRFHLKTDIYERDSNHLYFLAAQRLRLLLSGASYDIIWKDVYYHQSCYLKYSHPKQSSTQDESFTLDKENDVMEDFFKHRIKVIRDKCAYLFD